MAEGAAGNNTTARSLERVDRVLVLATGGLVGQGIIQALRRGSRTYWIEAACVAAESAGLYLGDAAYLSPFARDPDFPAWLAEVCARREIDLVLAGQEDVLETLALHRQEVEGACGVILGVDDYSRLRLTRDKLRMYERLRRSGIATPETVACDDARGVAALIGRYEPPWVLKPRFGTGSSGLMLLSSRAEVSRWEGDATRILQQFVAAGEPELTVACLYSTRKSLIGAVAMERQLASGSAVWARLLKGETPAASLAVRIGSLLGVTGPCNVQFRPGSDGALYCHDVNLRFSSTVDLRAEAGFNDAAAAVAMWLGRDEALSSERVRADVAVRYLTTQWHDATLAAGLRAGATVTPHQPRGEPLP